VNSTDKSLLTGNKCSCWRTRQSRAALWQSIQHLTHTDITACQSMTMKCHTNYKHH